MALNDYITLGEAQEITVTTALKASHGSGGNTSFTTADVNRAIYTACEEALRRSKLIVTTGTVALTATAVTVDVTSISGFRPHRAIRFETLKVGAVGYDKIDHVDYDSLADEIAGMEGTSIGTSVPTRIAFRTPDYAILDRVPGTSYPVLTVTYRPTATELTGTTGTATTLNIPAEYIRPILWYGAAMYLEHYDDKSRIPADTWNRWQEHLRSIAGDKGMDTGQINRNSDFYL